MRTITILTTTKLFSGIYLWNYFQKYPSVFELFPAYMSVSGIISRHICVCLELFPDIRCSSVWKCYKTYVSVWNYFQHTCQYLELFPDIYVSVWNYFQTYIAGVSGNISRHICQCLELFPVILSSSVWKNFQKYMSVTENISRQILQCLEFPGIYVSF